MEEYVIPFPEGCYSLLISIAYENLVKNAPVPRIKGSLHCCQLFTSHTASYTGKLKLALTVGEHREFEHDGTKSCFKKERNNPRPSSTASLQLHV